LSGFVQSNATTQGSNVNTLSGNVHALSQFVQSNTLTQGSNVNTLSGNVDGLSQFVQSNATTQGSNVNTLSANVAGLSQFVQSNATTQGSNVNTLSANVDGLSEFVQSITGTQGGNVETLSANVDGLSQFVQSNATTQGSNVNTLSANVAGLSQFVQSNATTQGSNVNTLSANVSNLNRTVEELQANIGNIADEINSNNITVTGTITSEGLNVTGKGTIQDLSVTNLTVGEGDGSGGGGGLSGVVGIRTDVFTGGIVDGDLFQYNGAIYGNADGLTGFSTKSVTDLEARLADYANSSRRLYVSTTGSDDNKGTSRDQAFRTIKKACSVARTLTVIFVEAGTYTEDNPIYVPPNVAISGDSLRNTLLLPANPRIDYFHLTNMNYLIQLRFVDLRSPGFCCAFPCSIADPYISNGKVVPKHDYNSKRINVIYSPKAPTGYYNTNLPPIDTLPPATTIQYTKALFDGIAYYIRDPAAAFPQLAINNPGGMKRAADLLIANILFLQNEIMVHVQKMIDDGDLTLTTNQKNLCRRDVGYIINAVAQDLRDGQNVLSLAAAVRYYDGTGSSILTSGTETPTARAILLLSILATYVVQQIEPGASVVYSLTSGGTTFEYTHTMDKTIPQETYAVTAEEPGLEQNQTFNFVIQRTQALLDLFADIVEISPQTRVQGLAASIVTGAAQNRVADLVQQYKRYLQNVVMNWVNSNITITFDTEKCRRDVGYIVDALTTDLRSGGALLTREYALLYYDANSDSVLPADQLTPTANAIRYLRDVCVDLIRTISDPQNVFDQSRLTSFETVKSYRNLNGTQDAAVTITLELPAPKLYVGYRLTGSNLKKFKLQARETPFVAWKDIHSVDNVPPPIIDPLDESEEAAPIAQVLFKSIASYIEDNTFVFPDEARKNAGGYAAAGSLLSQNLLFIQAEVRGLVESMIDDGTLPSSFDAALQDKCIRDVGFLVTSVANDLIKGGFPRSLESAEKYRGSVLPQNTVSPTAKSIEFIGTLATYIIRNVPVPQDLSRQFGVAQIFAPENQINQQTYGTTATVAYSYYRLIMIQTQEFSVMKLGGIEFLEMAPPNALCDGPTITNTVVSGFEIIEAGIGYANGETDLFVEPEDSNDTNYTPAIAKAVISGGKVVSTRLLPKTLDYIQDIAITNSGEGYVETPEVTFTGGGGTGAKAVAWIDKRGRITQIDVVNKGQGYTSQPTVSFEYIERIEQLTVPVIRPNTVILQSSFSVYPGSNVFDESINTFWQSQGFFFNGNYVGSTTTTVSATSYSGEWVQIQFQDPEYIRQVNINVIDTSHAPTDFVVAGSLDGITWSLIHRRTGALFSPGFDSVFQVQNPGTYTHVRFIATRLFGNVSTVRISHLKLFSSQRPASTPATATASITGIPDKPWTMGRGLYSGAPVKTRLGITTTETTAIIRPIMTDDFAELDVPLYLEDGNRNIDEEGRLKTVRIIHSGSGYIAPPDELIPTISIPAPEILRPVIVGSPYVQNCTNLSGPWDTTGEKVPVTWPLPWNVYNIYNDPSGPGYDSTKPSQLGKGGIRELDNNGSGGGIRIDGHVPSPLSPLRSYVVDAFTQVNQGGIGFLLINLAYAQFVSTFGTFCNVHAACISGATANFSNSVTDFGRTGLLARGYYREPYLRGVVLELPDTFTEAEDEQYSYNRSIPGYVSRVEAVQVTVNGLGYNEGLLPQVTIDTPAVPGQPQALASAEVVEGKVAFITVTEKGDGYKSIPNVSIAAPIEPPIESGGIQAEAKAFISNVSRCRVKITGGLPRRFANNSKPDSLSLVRIHGLLYTVTATSEVTDESGAIVPFTYDIAFGGVEGAPPYIDPGHAIDFFFVSQLSTGSHVFEFCGDKLRGCTYNALPEYGGDAGTQKQSAEIDALAPAKIYFTSSDHLGNQRIGDFFSVNQSTGSISVDAQSFDLSKIQRIGPFLRSGIPQGVALQEVSTNKNLLASTGQAAEDTVPTQSAVKAYVDRRAVELTGGNVGDVLRIPPGGADTDGTVLKWEWGQLTAENFGVVSVIFRADVISGLVADGDAKMYGNVTCYGDIESDAVILTSPGNKRFRVTVDDNGDLQREELVD
jgi:hypothetical protein